MKRGFILILSVIYAIVGIYFGSIFVNNYMKNYEKEVLLGGISIGLYPSAGELDNNEVSKLNNGFNAGTLTYIDMEDNSFGALGHDSKTNGIVIDTEVITYVKSTDNIGYKVVKGYSDNVIGNITKNTDTGVYGKYYDTFDLETINVGMPRDVHKGTAYIKTILENNEVQYFEISINKVNMFSNKSNIYFEIIDEELLNKTGGLIQGMSGSPILQDGKLIGAVSSANEKDFKKGYGVFITNMIEDNI